eukprot:Selendium_serpulae@DN9872_c0_g1_i1.p1
MCSFRFFFKFSEKSPPIRDALITACEKWLIAAGSATWVALLVQSNVLAEPQADLREGLLAILNSRLVELHSCDVGVLQSLVPMLVETVQDNKSKVVRQLSERLMEKVAPIVGSAVMSNSMARLRPAERRSLARCMTQQRPAAATDPVDGESDDSNGNAAPLNESSYGRSHTVSGMERHNSHRGLFLMFDCFSVTSPVPLSRSDFL